MNSKSLIHLNIITGLLESRQLPIEKRVDSVKKLTNYFKEHLTSETDLQDPEVEKIRNILIEEFKDATRIETLFNTIYIALLKIKNQLKNPEEALSQIDELLRTIACKSSSKSILYLLQNDEITIDFITRLYIAEHLNVPSFKKYSRFIF